MSLSRKKNIFHGGKPLWLGYDTNVLRRSFFSNIINFIKSDDELKKQKLENSVGHVIADGVFDKHEQTIISETFGEEKLSKLVTTLSGMDEDDVESFITAKLNQSHQELVAAFPSDYESVLENITNNISKNFS